MNERASRQPDRRSLLRAAGSLVMVSALPLPASATPESMQAAIENIFGAREIMEGRVTLKLPPIAENGNSVSLQVTVQSPMTEADHVTRVAVFSPANPLPNVARFTLGPRAGLAKIGTRIRLADTQTVRAIAEMNDGSLWSGTAATLVTLAACAI